MKAIVQDRYGSADVLQLREIEPPAVGDDDVLVRVRAAGVDPSVWHLMTGRPFMVRLMGLGLRTPKAAVRGLDVAGTVEAVGKNVTRFRKGDAVFGGAEGSYAELAVAHEKRLAKKPSKLPFEQAAVVPVSGCTALQALRDAGNVQPGQRVLVTGAGGGVGTFAVQIAKALKAEVTAVCGTSKIDLALTIGADHVIDYTREDFADGVRHYDLIIDAAGRRPLRHLRRALNPAGRAVIVGGDGGDRFTGGFFRQVVRAPLYSRLTRPQEIRGLMAEISAEDLDCLRDFIEAGKVTPVVDKTYPLAQAAEALRHLGGGHSRGKAVIVVK